MASRHDAGPSSYAGDPPGRLDPYHIIINPRPHRQPHLESHAGPAQPAMTSTAEGAPLSQARSLGSDSGEDSSTLTSQTVDDHGRVRTLPVWIESFEVGDTQGLRARGVQGLPAPPAQIHSAQHHFDTASNPRTSGHRRRSKDGYESEEDEDAILRRAHGRGIFGVNRDPVKGRKWDYARSDDPVVVSRSVRSQSPWVVNLIRSSMYGPAPNEDRYQATQEYLQAQTPGYLKPWRGDTDEEKGEGLLRSKKEQRALFKRIQVSLYGKRKQEGVLTSVAYNVDAPTRAASFQSYSFDDVHRRTGVVDINLSDNAQQCVPSNRVNHHGHCRGHYCNTLHWLHNMGRIHRQTAWTTITQG